MALVSRPQLLSLLADSPVCLPCDLALRIAAFLDFETFSAAKIQKAYRGFRTRMLAKIVSIYAMDSIYARTFGRCWLEIMGKNIKTIADFHAEVLNVLHCHSAWPQYLHETRLAAFLHHQAQSWTEVLSLLTEQDFLTA